MKIVQIPGYFTSEQAKWLNDKKQKEYKSIAQILRNLVQNAMEEGGD